MVYMIHTLDLIRRLVDGHRGRRRKDDLAYLICQAEPGYRRAPRTFRLYLLIPPKPPGSSLNHEGNHKSYHAVSLLSHVYFSTLIHRRVQ
jgi:hypothetical protein